MTPEQKARVSIDTLLQQAGWHVCNVADANIHASVGRRPRMSLTVSHGMSPPQKLGLTLRAQLERGFQ